VGASIGRCGIVPSTIDSANINQAVAIIRVNEALEPSYLLNLILSPYIQKSIHFSKVETARPNISLSDLNQLSIPLPPRNEQKRIVAAIESLRNRSQNARSALSAIPELCDKFRQSVLAAAFRGDLTADWREQNPAVEPAVKLVERIYNLRRQQYEKECLESSREGRKKPRHPPNLEPQIRFPEYKIELPETWSWMSFEDVSSIRQHAMSSGPFGSALGTKDYREAGVPVIRGQNIQNGKFVASSFVYVSKEKALELSRSNAYPGDIVVVAVGSSGQAALVPEDLPRAVLSQNCNKVTVDQSFVNPKFIVLLLQNEIATSQMAEKTTDTVRQFLSLTNLKTTLLPVPPLAEQNEVVKRVEKLSLFASQLEKQYQELQELLIHLDRAILAKAFRGELVEQDPNDEPASVLLERIRTEREQQMQGKAKKPWKKGQRTIKAE
jgi:type I restriction enzyme S subunit